MFRKMMAAIAGAVLTTSSMAAADIELVKPSAADPSVIRFDDPSIVIADGKVLGPAPLAIFLPGTGGKPQGVLPLLKVVAGQGYRVIGLSYDDVPAVQQVCPLQPDPDCARAFREMRAYGTGKAAVVNPPAESIETRLAALLRWLAAKHPGRGWDAYLTADGKPAWDRILVSGQSQGAGMAAFIAKRTAVYRVVLFSSPWDTAGSNGRGVPAPWLSTPSATPPERWWAERHAKELTTELLARTYRALAIPSDHILIFDRGLPPGIPANAPNPYHGSTVKLVEYKPQWRELYGEAR